MSENKTELLPCPFCGTAPRKRIGVDESLWSHDTVKWLTIVCDECDCESKSSEVHDEVIAAWNRRAAIPHSAASGARLWRGCRESQ